LQPKVSVKYNNEGDEKGTECYDMVSVKQIVEGQTCVMKPTTHPCLTGYVSFTCPSSNVSESLVKQSMMQQHCEICAGMTRTTDWDGRPGWMEFQLSWGPNAFDGKKIVEDTTGILGYAVFAVSECGEREGDALVTVAAQGIKEGSVDCCETMTYVVNVPYQLPGWLTGQKFMVVPMTSIGPLDMGWVSDVVVDAIDSSTYGAQAVAQAAGQPASAAVQSESHTHESGELTHDDNTHDDLQSSVSETKTAAPAPTPAPAPTQNEEKKKALPTSPSPQEQEGSAPQEEEEEEGGMPLPVIIAIAVGIPVGGLGLYALSKALKGAKADGGSGNPYTKRVSP
jgi:hypothetical protein